MGSTVVIIFSFQSSKLLYEQDKYARITWHLVNENIDDGDIIIQKNIKLNNTETSILLVRKLMSLAFDAYKEIEDSLLNWNIKTVKMKPYKYQIHYAKDIPNNGFLDKNWSSDKISAFLRAMDCGFSAQFPKPQMIINNQKYEIINYSLTPSDKLYKIGDFYLEVKKLAGNVNTSAPINN